MTGNQPKPFTKTQRRNVRENTYRVIPLKVCQNCAHCWFYTGQSGVHLCQAVEYSGKSELKQVAANGTCELWEGKR